MLPILFWITAAPCALLAQGSEPVTLRLGSREGSSAEYRHEKRLTLYLPAELGGTTTTRTTLRLEQTLDHVGPDSVVFDTGLRELEFDIEPRPAELPDLRPLEGLRFRSTATRSGRIVRVELEGVPYAATAPLREQVGSWLRELGFPALPVGPVRPGESWTDTARVPLASLIGVQGSAEAVEVRTTKFADLLTSEHGSVAVFEVSTRWTGSGDATSPSQAVVSGSSDQTARFAVEEGRYIDSRGSNSIHVEILTAPGVEPVRIDADGFYQTILLAEDG